MPLCNTLAASNRLAPLTQSILSRPAPTSLIAATRDVRPPLSARDKWYKNCLRLDLRPTDLVRPRRPYSSLASKNLGRMVLNDMEKLDDVQKVSHWPRASDGPR